MAKRKLRLYSEDEKHSPFSSFFFFSPLPFPRLLLGAMHAPNGERASKLSSSSPTAQQQQNRNIIKKLHALNWRFATQTIRYRMAVKHLDLNKSNTSAWGMQQDLIHFH